jgi:hypothetical protein
METTGAAPLLGATFQGMGGKLAIAAAITAIGAAVAWTRPALADSSEAELKAELVERFTRFVDWEDRDLPGDEFTVCVIGETPITTYLERLVKNRTIKGRKGRVRTFDRPELIDGCQLVLIGGGDKKRLAAVLSRTEGRPILTVADAPGAGAAGAIINFYRTGSHVKFEINIQAASDSDLEMRSKLLKLARVVKGG